MSTTNSQDVLGGFIIQCDDGGTVSVTADQAVKLFEKCEYFKNVFRHGTKENEELVLKKPDWSTETAQCIIGLLVNGNTSTSVDKYPILLEAADQILVQITEIYVCCPTKTNTSLNDEEVHKVLALANKAPICKIRSSKSSFGAVWNECLQNNILLLNDKKMIDLEIHGEPKRGDFDFFWFLNSPDISLTIYTALSLTSAILKIGDIFRCKEGTRGEKIFHNEELSIRVPSPSLLFAMRINDCFDKLKETVNLSGYLHSGTSRGYFLGGNSVVEPNSPTLFGSAEKLKLALDVILHIDSSIELCSLRIAAPSSQTLEKLARACQRCADNPGTLGVHFESNAFFAVKSVRDIKIMLEIISGNESYSPNTDVLEIVHLTNPKGIF